MDLSPFAYAYGAGMLAAFNPCGFVLLPTYVAAFLANGPHGGIRSAVGTSGKLTAGFFVVFTLLGTLVAGAGVSVSTLGNATSWLGVVTGAILLVVGAVMLLGRKLPGVQIRLGSGRGAFSYGIGYAAASLACALPVFLSAVVYTFDRGGLLDGFVSGLAYAAGMGSVVSLVVLLTATTRQGAIRRLRGAMQYFTPVSGVLLILAGIVLIARRWMEITALEHLSATVTDTADRAVWLPAAAALIVVAAARLRRRTTARRNTPAPVSPTDTNAKQEEPSPNNQRSTTP